MAKKKAVPPEFLANIKKMKEGKMGGKLAAKMKEGKKKSK